VRANADAWADWQFSELAIEATEKLRGQGKECRAMILDAGAEDSFYVAERSKEWGWKSQIIFVSKLDDLRLRILAAELSTAGFFLLPDEAGKAITHTRWLCNQ
jgi:hypothetical protein